MTDRSTSYLIWSHEHCGWWRSGRCGYSPNLWDAGFYDAADAQQIVEQAAIGWNLSMADTAPPEVMVPLPENFTRRGMDDVLAELRASIDAATAQAVSTRTRGAS